MKNNFKMINGQYLNNSTIYSLEKLKRLGREMEDLNFVKGMGYIAPVTYRNFIRANREHFYKPRSEEEVSRIKKMIEAHSMFNKEDGTTSLWDHQTEILNFNLCVRQGIVAAEQRTGKTSPTLDSIQIFLKDLRERHPHLKDHIEQVYWIAPKSGVRSVTDEIIKWGKSIMAFEVKHKVKIHLMTYEWWRANWLNADAIKLKKAEDWEIFESVVKKYSKLIPRICVFDEVHKLKSEKGVQGKLSRLMRPAQEILYENDEDFMLIGLSGTPAPKEPSDWWNILEMTNPGFIPESNTGYLKDRLAEIYMKEDEASGLAFPAVKYWKKDELEKFSKEIEQVVLTIWKSDALDLPEKDHVFIELEQSAETKQAVRFLERTRVDSNGKVMGAATLRQKLRQISDGFMYEDNYDAETNLMERSVTPIDTPKVAQLRRDLNYLKDGGFNWQEGIPDNRVMITGGYRGTIDIIRNTCLELGWNVLELTGQGWSTFTVDGKRGNRDSAISWLKLFDRSHTNHVDVINHPLDSTNIAIIGHPKSMATGLELSRCGLMIAFSHTDDGESEFQVLDRAHSNNMDKVRGFHIHHYCHLKYDLMISKSLRDKKKLQSITMSDIVTAMREDLYNGMVI